MASEWFEIWFADKQSILETMIRNMASDLEAGYSYFGNCITRQRQMIDEYKAKFDAEMEAIKQMEPSRVGHWCYFDLRKRGAIS